MGILGLNRPHHIVLGDVMDRVIWLGDLVDCVFSYLDPRGSLVTVSITG